MVIFLKQQMISMVNSHQSSAPVGKSIILGPTERRFCVGTLWLFFLYPSMTISEIICVNAHLAQVKIYLFTSVFCSHLLRDRYVILYRFVFLAFWGPGTHLIHIWGPGTALRCCSGLLWPLNSGLLVRRSSVRPFQLCHSINSSRRFVSSKIQNNGPLKIVKTEFYNLSD